ncbi:hypothetical protein ACGF5C_30780 [Micromonospora sp. NPDC047620]|uniref:hypothetical protein n=1 Tax=Micromonospora sp. NPDC047620 TaxID=3364251 RepID=UPI00371BF0DB
MLADARLQPMRAPFTVRQATLSVVGGGPDRSAATDDLALKAELTLVALHSAKLWRIVVTTKAGGRVVTE